MKQEIETLINDRINPALSAHMGACELVSVNNGVVSLRLTGGCKGCPGKQSTLLNGIKPLMLDEVQGVTDVVLAD